MLCLHQWDQYLDIEELEVLIFVIPSSDIAQQLNSDKCGVFVAT